MNFKHYLQQQGHSKQSVATYRREVRYYLEWLERERITPEEAQKTDILAYVRHCTAKHNQQQTIQHKLGSIRHYYLYRAQSSELADPTQGIVLKGIKRSKLHYLFTLQELTQLYEH